MQPIDRLLKRIEYLTDTLAIASMLACMILVSSNVFFRYAMKNPQGWITDLLVMYLLPAVFFMGLPGSYAKGSHVAVDIICNVVSERSRLILSLIARVVAIGVLFAIAWYGGWRVYDAVRLGELLPGAINWPRWPSVLLVPIGAGLTMLRAIERLAAELLALGKGREEIRKLVRATAHEEGLPQ